MIEPAVDGTHSGELVGTFPVAIVDRVVPRAGAQGNKASAKVLAELPLPRESGDIVRAKGGEDG
jgi:hypothetical protein